MCAALHRDESTSSRSTAARILAGCSHACLAAFCPLHFFSFSLLPHCHRLTSSPGDITDLPGKTLLTFLLSLIRSHTSFCLHSCGELSVNLSFALGVQRLKGPVSISSQDPVQVCCSCSVCSVSVTPLSPKSDLDQSLAQRLISACQISQTSLGV